MRAFIPALLLAACAAAGEFDPACDAVLSSVVRDGRVDYALLKADPSELHACLDRLAGVTSSAFEAWDPDGQLAFLINLYNAATLKLIVDHYPIKSIKDIGSLFNGPWDQPVVRLWGGVVTLNHLEHDIIRKRYAVPEIHFALVCAAKGCPPLRDEAYVGAQLGEQLADQRRRFLTDEEKNEVEPDRRRVSLSPIFKWYAEDFEKAAGSVLAYLKPHWSGVDESYSVIYTRYDWTLNEP